MSYFFKKPLVSVILTSYNHEDFIEEAISDVLGQSLSNLELIIVDDCSTDGSVAKIEKIKDPRIRLIKLDKNRRYHPRNTALKSARGKYIAFQNSDDKWSEKKIERQIEEMEKNSDLAVCFTGVEIIDEKSNIQKNSWVESAFETQNTRSSDWLRRFFDVGNCFFISSSLVRRKRLEEVGVFNPSLFQLSDFDLWVRLAAVGEFHIIEDKLSSMRIVEDKNLSSPNDMTVRRSMIEYLEVLKRYKEKPVLGRLPDVFNDVYTGKTESEAELLGGLALYAWGLSPIHLMFGNGIIGDILKDEEMREELVSIYGTEIIQEYVKNEGYIEIHKFGGVSNG